MKPIALTALLATLCVTVVSAEEPRKIAFVDTGNTGRSVTAEALAQVAIRDNKMPIAVIGRAVDFDPFDVTPEPNAASLLMQHGIDVSRHLAAQLSANDVKHADLILTMTAKHKAAVVAMFPEAKDKVFTLAEYATGTSQDVVDAYGKPMPVYQQVYDQIDSYLQPALAKSLQK